MTKNAAKPLPIRTVAQVYREAAKSNNGQVPKGGFAARVATVAATPRPAGKAIPQFQRRPNPTVNRAPAPKPAHPHPAPQVQAKHQHQQTRAPAAGQSPQPLPIRTVAKVYQETAKSGNGQVQRGSFAAAVAKEASRHAGGQHKRK